MGGFPAEGNDKPKRLENFEKSGGFTEQGKRGPVVSQGGSRESIFNMRGEVFS